MMGVYYDNMIDVLYLILHHYYNFQNLVRDGRREEVHENRKYTKLI